MHVRALSLAALASATLACSAELEPGPAKPSGGPGHSSDPAAPGAGGPSLPAGDGRYEPVPYLARRLTREELRYTLQDQLDVQLDEADLALVPEDRPLEGFVNIASGQTVSPDHARGYHALALRIAERIDRAALIDAHAPCERDECGADFVASLGAQLFRRPLSAREREAYEKLFQDVRDAGADFARSATAVLEAMLQSPQFLYLLPADDVPADQARTLGGYELAARLSYALWASAPDAALQQAAAEGRLDRPEGLAAEVARMLGDERARRISRRFLLDWARLEALPDDDGLRAQRVAAALAYFEDYLWEREGSLWGLFTDPTAVLTPALARAYGLQPAGSGPRAYDLSALDGPVGLLSQPGVVAGMTNADGGEIVARGLFMMEQLFCGSPPDPPANLADLIEEVLQELPEDASQRDIAEARLARPACAGCHSSFDPLAYAFERFDARGARRDTDELGNTLRTDGWIPGAWTGGEDRPYAGLRDYAELLASDARVRACMTRKHVEYALGARLGPDQAAAVDQVLRQAEDGGGRYRDLLRAITSHTLFRTVGSE